MPIRIIIAADHAVLRGGLRALLEKEADFEIVGEAGSGMDTIRVVEEKTCDVLILDISMPGMTGTTAAKEILKKHPKLSILALTMHDNEHYVRELFWHRNLTRARISRTTNQGIRASADFFDHTS